MSAGRAAPTEPLTRLLEGWVYHLGFERRLSPRSVAAYRGDLAQHLDFLHERGVRRIEEITPDLVREWLARQHDAGRAARSRLRARSSLRGFYGWLTRGKHLSVDPSRDVEAPRTARLLPDVLDAEEITRLLDACGGPGPLDVRDRAMIEPAYGTGVRASELVGLGSEEIDFRNGLSECPRGLALPRQLLAHPAATSGRSRNRSPSRASARPAP